MTPVLPQINELLKNCGLTFTPKEAAASSPSFFLIEAPRQPTSQAAEAVSATSVQMPEEAKSLQLKILAVRNGLLDKVIKQGDESTSDSTGVSQEKTYIPDIKHRQSTQYFWEMDALDELEPKQNEKGKAWCRVRFVFAES